MPNSTQVKISVLDQFSPDVLGIFWITNEDLNRDLSNFEDFNYLFDGLISQYIYGQETTSDKHAHIFFTENYNSKIFLAHLRTRDLTKSKIAADIDDQIALLQASNTKNKIIYVLDRTSENWLSDLKTRHPFFIFRALKT